MTTGVSALDVIDALRGTGQTVATAESLTGGLLCATLVDVPGASDVLRGGVVAYLAETKSDVLGVDPALVERLGTVHPDVAAAMAEGAIRVMGSTWRHGRPPARSGGRTGAKARSWSFTRRTIGP